MADSTKKTPKISGDMNMSRWSDERYEESERITAEIKAKRPPEKPYRGRTPMLQKNSAQRAAEEKAAEQQVNAEFVKYQPVIAEPLMAAPPKYKQKGGMGPSRWDDNHHEESAKIAAEMKANLLPDKPNPSRTPLMQKNAAERAAEEQATVVKLASANVKEISNNVEANVALQKPTDECDIPVEKKYGGIAESRYAKPEQESPCAGVQTSPAVYLPTIPLPASRDIHAHDGLSVSNIFGEPEKIGASIEDANTSFPTPPSEKGKDAGVEAGSQPPSATLDKPTTQPSQSSATQDPRRTSSLSISTMKSEKQSTTRDPPHPQDGNNSELRTSETSNGSPLTTISFGSGYNSIPKKDQENGVYQKSIMPKDSGLSDAQNTTLHAPEARVEILNENVPRFAASMSSTRATENSGSRDEVQKTILHEKEEPQKNHQELRAKFENVGVEKTEAENQISKIKDAVSRSEKSLEDITSKYETVCEDLEEKNELLEKATTQVSTWEASTKQLKRDLKNKTKAADDLQKKLDDSEALILEHSEDLEEKTKALREAEGDIKALKKDYRSEKSRADRAEKELSDLMTELEDQKGLTAQAKEETCLIREELRKLKTTFNEQEKTIAELKSGKEQQDHEMNNLKQKMDNFAKRLAQSEAAKQPSVTISELASEKIANEEPKVEQAGVRQHPNTHSIWKQVFELVLLFVFYFNLISTIVTYGPGFHRQQQAWFKGSLQQPIVVSVRITENKSSWNYNASSSDLPLPLEIIAAVSPTLSIDPEDITITVTKSAEEPIPIEIPFNKFYQKLSFDFNNPQRIGILAIVASGLTWVAYHHGSTLLSSLR